MAHIRQFEISPVAGAIAVRNINAVTPNAYEYYQFTAIKSVTPASELGFGTRSVTTNERKNPVRYTDKLEFIITFHDENESTPIKYNIHDVANQPGWTDNFAGLEQAVSDINEWIGAGATALKSMEGNTETPKTIQSLIDGSTPTPCKGFSIYFDGTGGTLDGVAVPDGYISSKTASASNILAAESYTVPTGLGISGSGLIRVVIGYTV